MRASAPASRRKARGAKPSSDLEPPAAPSPEAEVRAKRPRRGRPVGSVEGPEEAPLSATGVEFELLLLLEDRFGPIGQNLPDVVFVSDAQTRQVLYSSPAYERIWGRSRESLYAEPGVWLDDIHPDDRPVLAELPHLGDDPPAPHDAEYRIIRPDGAVRWIWSRWMPLRDSGGKTTRIAGIARDISDRKELELELQRSLGELESRVEERTSELAEANARIEDARRFLAQTIDSLAARIAILDGTGRVVSVNRSWREAADGAIDRLVFCPEGQDYLSVCDRLAGAGGAEFARLSAAIRAVIAGERVSVELAIPLRQTEMPKWLVGHITRFVDQTTMGAVVALEDVTELRNAQEELRQREALASLGRLAAGIAHEINNPLASILAAAELGLAQAGSGAGPDRTAEAFRSIVRLARRGGRIVQGVLQFARQEPVEKALLDLSQVIERAVEALREEPRWAAATIRVDLQADLSPVWGNSVALEQAFVNLLRNGLDTGDPTAHVEISLRSHRPGWLRASVRDDGPGVPREQIPAIFDPFFTTREAQGGSGLGLSIVHGVVTDHGGTVSVSSRPGHGATFFVDLPIAVRGTEIDSLPTRAAAAHVHSRPLP